MNLASIFATTARLSAATTLLAATTACWPGIPVAVMLAGGGGGGGGGGSAASIASDPLLGDEWHLNNVGQGGGVPGEDANVLSVHAQGGTGTGVLVAVVDSSMQHDHPDLTPNIASGMSYDYKTGGTTPVPTNHPNDFHATAVAGVAAARGGNGLGVSGAAPRAQLCNFNLLSPEILYTDANAADAMVHDLASVDVSNNSWGPAGGPGYLWPAPSIWSSAINDGVSNGRSGRGVAYLFAAGNEGHLAADTNYSGYTTSPGVTVIGAVGDDGKRAIYSTPGATICVAAPSLGNNQHGITTTDRTGTAGYNASGAPDYADLDYTGTFSGTSSATPLVSGVVALMLEANPSLTFWDVRSILARTARKNDPRHADWQVNEAGFHVNHDYGFGVVDADAATNLSRSWQNPGKTIFVNSPIRFPGITIPDNSSKGASDSLTVSGSGIRSLDFVTIVFTSDHRYSSQLKVVLVSPKGTASVLARSRVLSSKPLDYNYWPFGTLRCLDEPADGTWTLYVYDLISGYTGKITSWFLTLYGH